MDSSPLVIERFHASGYTPESRTGYDLTGACWRGNLHDLEMGHLKSRHEIAANYPERYPVPDKYVPWSVSYPGYDPLEVDAKKARDTHTPGLLATDNPTKAEFVQMKARGDIQSMEGEVHIDAETGRPLNVRGRTGLEGRGALWKWAANFAADPIVIRMNEETGNYEMVAIKRANGEWALPGGFVNAGEHVSRAVVREFSEEATGGTAALEYLKAGHGMLLYSGYVDDPRNTDNAWIETTAFLFYLPKAIGKEVKLEAGDDAQGVKWMPLTAEELSKPMYANHKDFVLLALANIRARESQRTLVD